MKVPVSWLRDYVDFAASLPELAERIAVASAEVERISRRGVPDVDGNLGLYRVALVLEAGKHPNADRLQLCRVDVGEGEPRQIVCGAWNFGAGATVAVALPGAVLPDGRRLERATLRGSVSDGMILSERELELGPEHAGILVLTEPSEPGTPLGDVLPIRDEVLEIGVTGNRSDLLSVYGIAREVSALFCCELRPPPGADPPMEGEEPVRIEVDDLEGCPRYIGRLFRGARVGSSPPWMRARLVASGMRPISNVVDVTNYVMHALGSPLHVFDADRLEGGMIGVRRARPGEAIVTLDGSRRVLDPGDLLITDAVRPVAVAGVMGGLDSEVGAATTNVLLEAANFESVGILRASERLGLRSEASNRWEKGVDPSLAGQAAAFATELIVGLAGARWTGHSDVYAELPGRPVTRLRPEKTDAVVGISIPPEEQRAILERLGFEVAEDWSVVVPGWRARDVSREIDLVEEVARVHGLEKVPFTLPARRAMFGRLSQEQRLRRLVEDVMVGCGFSEAYTWSLVSRDGDPDALRLSVPLSAEHAILRTSLVEGLVGAARHNADVGNEQIALFEVARVYLPTPFEPGAGAEARLPHERWRLGGIARGAEAGSGFFRAKGAVETLHEALRIEPFFEPTREPFLHPGKSARIGVAPDRAGAGRWEHAGGVAPDRARAEQAGFTGWVGELHPALLEGSWGIFELDLERLFAQVPERTLYEDVITYPALRQDLAFVVPEAVLVGDLVDAMRDAAGQELREARVFDVYRGGQIPAGFKSVAVAVAFQSPERTLTDEDGRALRELVVAALGERFGAELRS